VRRPELLRDRRLLALLVAETVSTTGSQMTWLALPWFVLTTTGSPGKMTLVLASEAAGLVLMGLPGGTILTRLGSRWTMMIADGARAPFMLVIPLLYWSGALTFPVLGEDVLISGAGPIGCMAAAVVRHAGARHVVVTDPNHYRLELASRMGATMAVDPAERELRDVQRELGMTEGFDIGLEMSGNPQALRAMIDAMAHGGRMALLGIPAAEVTLDLNPVIFDMLTLKGIYGREMFESWYQMTVLVESGLDLTPVITHRFSYRDFEEAFAVARSGQSGKVVLDWTQLEED